MTIYNLLLLLILQTDLLAVQMHRLLRAGDAYNAGLAMDSYGDPKTISNNYIQVSNYLYWTASDLPSCITFSQLGIDTSLANARQVQSSNPPLAAALQQSAATLAYNLASFTWPGWGEPGIEITPADLAKGFMAAEMAVQLRTQLNAEPQGMFDANWALGAHELARGRYREARAAFEKSLLIASGAGLRGSTLLARGYIGITKAAAKSDADQGEAELKEAKDALIAQGIEDGQSLVSQLDTAYRVFVNR